MSQTQMISTTQVYARPRHQFMPNWMPRSQHGHKQYAQAQGGQVNVTAVPVEFDGKRLRKPVARKTVDYNSSMHEWLQERIWQRDHRDKPSLQPDPAYQMRMATPSSMINDPANVVTSKFVRAATNKMKCPVFCVTWTPEGRRLITGASSGEFTLWNGLTFNFETILQAHELPVRCMTWSCNDQWMVTGDHGGYIKYWQTNMNNVRMFQGHKEAVRGISFCPTDLKFTSCSDDGTVRVWDFQKCHEERILRGHGSDVKCVDWHPQKSLIVSGSKDSQQPIKLWCPKSGQSIATIHAHKSTVMDARWNRNGNWLITASRDHLIKLFDVRKLNVELQTFRGHKREACTLAWHTVHEEVFASGGSDGSVMFWTVGTDKEIGSMDQAHDSCVWSLAWHPVGHILCTGSNDHTSKFWTRNRPGDRMRDRYNLNTLPRGLDDLDEDIPGMLDRNSTQEAHIPGMGIDADQLEKLREGSIPGLDDDRPQKKMPHSKPIHKGFQQQWMENRAPVSFKDGEGKPQAAPGGKQEQGEVKVDRPPPPPHMMQQLPPDMRHPPPDAMMQGLHMPPPNWMEGGMPFLPPPGPMGFPMGPPPFMNQGGPFRHPPPPRPPGDQWGGPPDGWRPPGDWDSNGNGDWGRGPGNWNNNNNNGPMGGGPMWRGRGRGAPRGMRGGPMGNMPRRGGNGTMWR